MSEIALGGHIIHATGPLEYWLAPDHERQIETKICRASPNGLEILQLDNALPVKKSSYSDFHATHWSRETCYQQPQHALALGVLLSCKEVYAEANAAPFSFNRHAFASPIELDQFAKLLGQHRFGQIRRILLTWTNNERSWSFLTSTPAISTPSFAHLQSLGAFVELASGDFMASEGGTLDTIQHREISLGKLEEFRDFRPGRVRVVVNDCVTSPDLAKMGREWALAQKLVLQSRWDGLGREDQAHDPAAGRHGRGRRTCPVEVI